MKTSETLFWIKKTNVPLSMTALFLVAIVLGGNFPGGNCLGDNHPEWQ
jgi:hypothetical protein